MRTGNRPTHKRWTQRAGQRKEIRLVDWRTHAVLLVWNPRYNPATISAHFKILKTHGMGFWGWIKDPESSMSNAVQLAGLLSKSETFLILVTDFASLHALRGTKMRMSLSASELEGDRVPKYYLGESRRMDCWFEFRGMQLLADSLGETLEFFATKTGEVIAPSGASRSQFAPYVSTATPFPLVISVPQASSMIPGPATHLKKEDVLPSLSRRARRFLEEEICDREHLGDLLPWSQEQLTNACVKLVACEPSDEADFSGDFVQAVRSLEYEILVVLRILQGERGGVVEPKMLGNLIKRLRETLTAGGEHQNFMGEAWWVWCEEVAKRRGHAAHARRRKKMTRGEFIALFERLLAESKDMGLLPVAALRRDLEAGPRL
jgi:hypothetical protein